VEEFLIIFLVMSLKKVPHTIDKPEPNLENYCTSLLEIYFLSFHVEVSCL
jgi:hypothetical protein